jgi:large subunit ribosomal protein L24
MKIKKGDTVRIMSGKDRGKSGVVFHTSPTNEKITIDGLNVFKKRAKPKRQGETGQTVLVPRPLPVSSVMIVCPSCKKPTRIGRRLEGSVNVRYCKKCKSTI